MRQLTFAALLVLLGGLALSSSTALAQGARPSRVGVTDSTALAQGARPSRVGVTDIEEFTSQDKEALDWANSFAAEISQVLERWISSREITEDRLFSRLYYPIPNSDPPKYTTDYDGLADRDFVPIQEKYLAKAATVMFAVTMDVNGYVPSHNKKYSLPATGNRAADLLNNRTKRMFGDRTGLAGARNEAPYFLQQYKRDTGEMVFDLSVPVNVKGRHWGAVRVGYRRAEK